MGRNKSVHPSVAHYAAGCRCDDCKQLKANRSRYYLITSLFLKKRKPLEHGDYAYYTKMKCRCSLCKAGNAAYKREFELKKKLTLV